MHPFRDRLTPTARFPSLLAVLALPLVLAGVLAPFAHAQNFAQPKVIPTGNWPAAVYSADVNSDGYPDLIYIDGGATPQASTTHVLLNDGHGNFTQSATLATVGNSLAIGDLMGSGHVDIGWVTADTASVTGRTNITIHIAPNSGAGVFAATQNTIVFAGLGSTVPGFVTAAHLFQTGPDGIIFEDTFNHDAYALQVSNGALVRNTILLLPDGPGPVSVADLNGDGNNDIIINGLTGSTLYGTPPSAQIFLYQSLNFGNNHTPDVQFPGTSGVHSLLVQDVNFDGIRDLIVEGAQGHIDVFPGNGDGTFQSASIGGTGPLDGTTGNGGHLIVAADLNGDGLLDALTATPAGVSTLLGNGTQYLGLKGISNAGPTGATGHPSYVTADFNRDGFLDLAVDSPEGIAILFGNGDGTFQTSRAFAAGQPAMSSALGIFTASGNLDAVVSTAAQQAQFLRGNGDGTFTYNGSPGNAVPTTTQTGTAGLWSIVQAMDLDRDGKTDIALTADGPPALLPQSPQGVAVQNGDGNGGFAPPNTPAIGQQIPCSTPPGYLYGTSSLYVGSGGATIIDRDYFGFWGLFYGNNLFIGSGNNYPNSGKSCGPFAHNLIRAGHFKTSNLDSDASLVIQGDGHLFMYGSSLFNTHFGDFSIDGSLTTPGQLVAPDISPTFPGPSSALGFRAFPGSMVQADFDGDGNNDLLVTYANLSADRTAPTSAAPNYLYLWFGDGTGHFPVSAAHPVNPVRIQLSRNYYQVAVADLNRDGIPDLILSDGYLLSVQLGIGDGTFGPESHYLAGQGINTISVGDVNADGAQDLVVANGGAVLTNPVANLETLATNPDVNTGGITVLLNRAQAPPPLAATSLSLRLCVDDPGSLFPCGNPLSNTPLVSPVTMYYGQVLDGVAIESATNLTGTITFYDGTRVFCTIPANLTGAGPMGNACPTNAGNFHAGNRSVDAVYSGDPVNAASTSNPVAVQVFPDLTTSAIASSLNPATAGQPVTFTATITGNFATPVGTVIFFDGLNQIGTATLDSNGRATFTTSSLAVGSHPIAVAYQGNSDFNPTAAPSALLNQIINPATPSLSPTTVILSAIGPTTILFNQPANSSYRVLVLDPVGHPGTGTVTVQDNGVPIPYCTAIPNGSTCPYAAGGSNRLSVGTHSLVVLYNGDAYNAPAASPPLVFTVLSGQTTITLTSSLNPAPLGAAVTFTAALSGTPNLPTGRVNIYDGTVLLANVPVDINGNATFTTSALALGTHPITVAYPGNANFGSATSPVLNQVIGQAAATPGTFTLSVTPSPITIPVGRTGLLLVTVTGNGGFAQPVALTCSTTTPETSCDFILPTIPSGGGSTTLELHTSAPHDCGDPEHPYFVGSCTPPPGSPATRSGHVNTFLAGRAATFLLPGLLLLGAGFTQARRRLGDRLKSSGLTLLVLILTLAGLTTLSGCGNCTDLGTPSGRYTFTVTATAQGGPVSQSQSQAIPLTITIP